MVILKAVALPRGTKPRLHVQAAIRLRLEHRQHLLAVARHRGLLPHVRHDEHGLEPQHLPHNAQP